MVPFNRAPFRGQSPPSPPGLWPVNGSPRQKIPDHEPRETAQRRVTSSLSSSAGDELTTFGCDSLCPIADMPKEQLSRQQK